MSDTVSGLLTLGVLIAMLAAVGLPLGAWLAKTLTDTKDWRVERAVYRLVRGDASSEQGWKSYATSVIAFSLTGVVLLFGIIVAQSRPPFSQATDGMFWHTALNTTLSFVTNTNWQSYAGEVGVGPFAQTVGLTVQNFVSAVVGISVVGALMRAIARSSVTTIGNFWVDLTRTVTKPFAVDELLARIRVALRRTQDESAPAMDAFVTQHFVLDFSERRAVVAGETVRLTPTEWSLLEVLARHADHLVPQRELLREVWGPHYGRESNYLRVYANRLRRKLEPDPSDPRYLVTEPGQGYRLMGDRSASAPGVDGA